MFNLRTVFSVALGRVIGAFFIAICIALGFGPPQWAAFVISAMPIFIHPSIARLGLLFLATLTLLLEWWPPVRRATEIERPRDRWLYRAAFTVAASLPFVVGAFYLTAKPQAQVPITVTIPAGQSLSNAAALPARMVGLTMPPEWDAAGLSFFVSRDGGKTYQPMYDWTGVPIFLGAAPDRYIILTPDVWSGVTNVKVQSTKAPLGEAVNQSASRTIYLATQF